MFPQFDPSKMDPKVLMELSQLIQQLPSDQLSKMQTLMHNAMAGFDVRSQMEEFERGLPPGFREKMMSLVMSNPGSFMPGMSGSPSAPTTGSVNESMTGSTVEASNAAVNSSASAQDMDVREARLTVLRGVASGQVTPEDAEKLLFG